METARGRCSVKTHAGDFMWFLCAVSGFGRIACGILLPRMGTYFLGSESNVIRLSGQKGLAPVEFISDLFTLNMYEWFLVA